MDLDQLDQLVERAFDWHWRHDGGASHISLDTFKTANPKPESDSDTFISEGTLYYRSSDDTCWAIDLTYLED